MDGLVLEEKIRKDQALVTTYISIEKRAKVKRYLQKMVYRLECCMDLSISRATYSEKRIMEEFYEMIGR